MKTGIVIGAGSSCTNLTAIQTNCNSFSLVNKSLSKQASSFQNSKTKIMRSVKLFFLFFIFLGIKGFTQNITTATNGLTKVGNNTVKLGGANALTENTSIDLGTSFYFNLKKNSSNYFTVLNGGNVGINTLTPSYTLDVNGTLRITSLLFPTGAGNGRLLMSDASGNASWLGLGSALQQLRVNAAGTGLEYFTPSGGGGSSQWITTGNDIYYDLGKVGINTQSPSFKLHVTEPAGNTPAAVFEGAGGSSILRVRPISGGGAVDIGFTGTGQDMWLSGSNVTSGFRIVGASSPLHLETDLANPIRFKTSNTERMIIDGDGKLGVGVSNPTEKLDINGNIRSSGFAQFHSGSFGIPNVRIGHDGTNPEAISINGASISAPAIKLRNLAYAIATGNAVIDIEADHSYMYGPDGSGAALKYKATYFNGSGQQHWGSYIDMQDNNSSSLDHITPYYTKVQTANGNSYGYFADATVKSGGTGTAYAFYANSGKSYFADNVGIGTNTASAQLHTTGSVRFQGLSTNNSLANILAADGNGNLSWRDASTLGGGGGGSSQWTTSGNNIYNNNSGNVGVGITNPAHLFHAAPVQYSTGTASQTGTTVTGIGTTWYEHMEANIIVFADGTRRTITSFVSPTQLTVAESGTVSNQPYKIHHGGLTVESSGKVTISTSEWIDDVLTVKSGIGTWSAGVARFESISRYASGTYNTIVGAFAPNVEVGSNINAYQFGIRNQSPFNSATWGFTYMGDGSLSNYASLGFWDVKDVVKFSANRIAEFTGDIYTGNGVTNVAPVSKSIHATGGSGTNVAGANLTLAGGKGTGSAAGGFLDFQTSDAGTSGTSLQSLTSKMRIMSNGNVGIGTTNPTNKLHVNGSVKLEGLGTQNGYTNILAADGAGNLAWRDASTLGGGGGSSQWLNAGSNIFYDGGNVSIGLQTIPAGYKLAVAGNIITEKVKVKPQSAGWPDYVFRPNYQLRSLKELESFIEENKHLPDVPSAAEVEANGLDLGDNQATLLKKIEELTLYIIEINKKVDKLSEENASLKKKLDGNKKQ